MLLNPGSRRGNQLEDNETDNMLTCCIWIEEQARGGGIFKLGTVGAKLWVARATQDVRKDKQGTL
jgi:hypothetical protein